MGYVAVDGVEILGCVFFSQLDFTQSNNKVFILSPMVVKTEFHGKGIGQALIHFAHEQLLECDVNLAKTYGDINFYSKVGYEHISDSKIAAPLKLSYPEGWLVNSLDGKTPAIINGPCTCIPELNDENLW